MSVYERIKEVRKSLGLTQIEFGDKIGIVQGHLTGIESGKKTATEKTIKVICGVYGISETWLKTGKGSMRVGTSKNSDVIDHIIRRFNGLNIEHQDFILQMAQGLLKLQRKQDRA